MPANRCELGFSCGQMMQVRGLEPQYCPNWRVCAKALKYAPEEDDHIAAVCRGKPGADGAL